jgi:probable F420-dependent oxidoreductase
MKIGISGIGIGTTPGADKVTTLAVNAERLGYSTIWVPEHVVLLDQYSSHYPYSPDHRLNMPMTRPFADPFITLTCAAMVTSKIRLATGICLVPEHNPLVLAKVIATLDFVSKGRVILGVGIGWLEEEFHAVGVPWERRAQRTRDYITAMRKLWGDELSSYAGEFVRFEGARSYPKPIHGAKLPVFFGGESGPALKRAAEYGDGWYGLNMDLNETTAKIRRLEEMLKANGRKRSDIEIAVRPSAIASMTKDDLKRYRDAGVDELVLVNAMELNTERETVNRLEQAAREWVEPATRI